MICNKQFLHHLSHSSMFTFYTRSRLTFLFPETPGYWIFIELNKIASNWLSIFRITSHPSFDGPFRYLSNLFAFCQWFLIWFCINWLSLFTEYNRLSNCCILQGYHETSVECWIRSCLTSPELSLCPDSSDHRRRARVNLVHFCFHQVEDRVYPLS